ncbi:hypothetical protein [Streptomyces sp. NPDC005349]|uniref:hypothetical protein n=1 Tax=unclassified Streptomyces TaxID=2593676 RepID=UPI0033BC0636
MKALIADLGPALDDIITELRYGTVALNAWTGVGHLTATATCEAFPGHTLDDVRSGIGVVHNALLLDGGGTHRRTRPVPPRSPVTPARGGDHVPQAPVVRHHTAATTGRLLTDFAAAPRWTALPAIFASTLRG